MTIVPTEQLELIKTARSPETYHLEHPLFEMLQPHIVKKFWSYHQDNPQIFALFLRFTRELVKAGRANYGGKAIAERIRWHVAVETKGEDFKIGNNHTACYSRLLVVLYPEFENFFSFRNSPGTVRLNNKIDGN